jgi:hypothetical protein
VDETIPADDITTATAKNIERLGLERGSAATEPAALRPRDWPGLRARGNRGSVVHWPLWYEDPFEDCGSEDGRFAWTWVDAAAVPATTGRWVIDALGLPVSMLVTPPFTIMSSDGLNTGLLYGFCRDAQVGPGQPADVGEASSLTVERAVRESEIPSEF